jgi:hypothetical protein
MRLIVEQGKLVGHEYALQQPAILIGRGQESDVVLVEHGVSRQHARIEPSPQGWLLIDLGSTNGTYVNGQQILAQQPYILKPGDRIAIGSSILAVEQDEMHEEAAAQQEREERALHPALLIGGALLFVIVLVGIVVLLVMLLGPKEALTTPTPMDQMEQIMTALPVPTEFQEAATSVVPMISTVLPGFQLGATATPPPPGAALPRSPAHASSGGPSP